MDHLQFILLDISPVIVEEWKRAFAQHVPDVIDKFSIVLSSLEDLSDPHRQFDCIVSPANSYGRLDGSFDYYLAEALSPNDVPAPTSFVQAALYKQWKGYAPPGSCTLIPLKGSSFENNSHGCAYIALCPTMRIPESVTWNREIVYNLMWSLLNSLELHNAAVDDQTPGGRIQKVLMTGLGTGVGNVSGERCAQQMALAVKDFLDASAHPEKWSSLSWNDAIEYAEEARLTHEL
ncbi:macro domain-like protein [Phlegmacium glaucopus]|nr:macro domain-like protein [Phlegmacium glaucopus]